MFDFNHSYIKRDHNEYVTKYIFNIYSLFLSFL